MTASKPTCFVVQGFGKKTDYTTGKEFNLDNSYNIIKMAVEAAGLECVRADEIVHSGTIDVPMYERLLNADLVVADLSTYNVNAAFELGVRYALKPYATVVLAEEGFKNPFDISHVAIRRYKHDGEDVGFKEANRLMTELKAAIAGIISANQTDSPVYTYLPNLQPPQTPKTMPQSAPAAMPPPQPSPFSADSTAISDPNSYYPIPEPSPLPVGNTTPSAIAAITGEDNPSAKILLDTALDKMNESRFEEACTLLQVVHNLRPNDTFIVQQMALATYKNKSLPTNEALNKAKEILQTLSPETTNNPETLGLWGSIHKKLWENSHDPNDLNEAISAHERGFYMKQDNYNGINLAFLLNERALHKLKTDEKDEAAADYIVAKRIRQDVSKYATAQLDSMSAEEQATPLITKNWDELTRKRFWIMATLCEASEGIGDEAAIAKWDQAAKSLNVPEWMQKTRIDQGKKLRELLNEYGKLAGKQA